MGSLIGGQWRGVLLDLDGTLVDSEPSHQATFDAFFTAKRWDVDDETRRHFMGRRASDVFATTPGPWAGEDPDALAAEVLSYIDYDATPPAATPGAVELVTGMHARNIPLALVTSANRAWAEYAVEEILGARDSFTAMVTWEDVPEGKPAPGPFLAGAKALGMPVGDTLAIEDSVPGLRSAVEAGVGRVIAVTTTHDAPELRAAGAHRVVDSLDELSA